MDVVGSSCSGGNLKQLDRRHPHLVPSSWSFAASEPAGCRSPRTENGGSAAMAGKKKIAESLGGSNEDGARRPPLVGYTAAPASRSHFFLSLSLSHRQKLCILFRGNGDQNHCSIDEDLQWEGPRNSRPAVCSLSSEDARIIVEARLAQWQEARTAKLKNK
ncbi:unnamed protein product [Spirodela intermedia]|uniref:Uncharacterized protein n=1 Tax=Spirodela intermedia TaxID=51605 RepID=A0A7I8JKQ2_SPIIN|nr:unnamed protein product [Spirodela intermedia]CAA6670052.1 unnamed protein product [Spirodela intermedia]